MPSDVYGPWLILSDGKPGHLNQSLALARYCERDVTLVPVRFRRRWLKPLSYLCDWLHLYFPGLLRFDGALPTAGVAVVAVVATGSETYYAAKLLSRKYGVPAYAIMLPRGYRYDFSLIVAQEHDRPPQRENILSLPVNLSRVDPQGVFRPDPSARYAALIVGGPNKLFRFDPDSFRRTLAAIFRQLPDHRLVVATSRRTPKAIDALLHEFPFADSFYFSVDPANPIPDFLASCEYVFITADSTSMISEAVTFGSSRVEVIPLPALASTGKYGRMLDRLEALGCVHRFDGQTGSADRKINLKTCLRKVLPCA